MHAIAAVTMLVAAFCGLTRQLVTWMVGGFVLAMVGLTHLLLRQPASMLHLVGHTLHLVLVFNVTYAAFLLLAAAVF